MADLLQKHLQRCCEENAALEPLAAQWAFDRRLAAKALQNVVKLFAHYSRHDESHSVQILTNIERVLGQDRIDKLSATDTWLLLEAAYHHDIGMVVSHEQQKKDWQSREFKTFLEQRKLRADANELEIIEAILKSDGTYDFKIENHHPLIAISRFGQLLAEYYRTKHADRAASIVESPLETIGLTSPRNELIPKRLFTALGEICRLHGQGRESLMRVPKVASGMAHDKVHPRFIACLLRIGDLLDLDDNRFCPVMLSVAGEIPNSTHAHIDKHRSVKHFRVDPERIEAHAECSTYDGYVESENWFDYLRDEIAWQMAHWADIVPDPKFGLLPTVGSIETELRGHELIDNKNRPHFQLESDKVIELLQGAGLYRNPFDPVRELIQNAVDATLMHVWLMHGESAVNSEKTSDEILYRNDDPYSDKVQNLLKKYPLTINITQSVDADNVPTTFLKIQDRGTGISMDELRSISKIGGSAKNTRKQEIISDMPVWLRPSGAFGIGLQSAFLVSKEINYKTKSVVTSETLEIRLADPIGAEKGAIYIKKQPNSISMPAGTTTELCMHGISIYSTSQERAVSERKFHDPVDDVLSDQFAKIIGNLPIPLVYNNTRIVAPNSSTEWEYDGDEHIAVYVDYQFTEETRTNKPKTEIFFKGQAIPRYGSLSTLDVKIKFNIFGSAEKILSVNRSEFKDPNIFVRLRNTLKKKLLRDYDDCTDPTIKKVISTLLLENDNPKGNEYLECYWALNKRTSFERKVSPKPNTTDSILLKDFLDHSNPGSFIYRPGDSGPYAIRLGTTIVQSSSYDKTILFKASRHQGFKNYLTNVFKSKSGETEYIEIIMSKSEIEETPMIAEYILCSARSENARLAIPLVNKFQDLAYADSIPLNAYAYSLTIDGRDHIYSPFIVKQGKWTLENFEKLVEYSFINRRNKSLTLDHLRNRHIELVRELDAYLSNSDGWAAISNYAKIW